MAIPLPLAQGRPTLFRRLLLTGCFQLGLFSIVRAACQLEGKFEDVFVMPWNRLQFRLLGRAESISTQYPSRATFEAAMTWPLGDLDLYQSVQLKLLNVNHGVNRIGAFLVP